jgi:hypothetical protein
MEDGLFPYAKWSLTIHFLGLILIVFLPKIVGTPNPSAPITKISSAIRVEMVSMPKLTPQEIKQDAYDKLAQKPILAKDLASDDGLQYLKKAPDKKRLKNLLSKNARRKLNIPAHHIPSSRKTSPSLGKELGRLVLQGNKLSKGWKVIGSAREMVMDEFGTYLSTLPDYVRPHWELPFDLLKKNLNCRIQIFLGKEGELLKSKIYTSSGNKEYDKRSLEAVRKTTFPPPGKNILKRVNQGDILLGFPL